LTKILAVVLLYLYLFFNWIVRNIYFY